MQKSHRNPLPITIWMNAPSFYQEDFFQALINSHETDLHVIYARNLPEDRQKLGWRINLNGYPHTFLNNQDKVGIKAVIKAIRLALKQKNRVHVVNGIWAEPSFLAALCVLVLWRCPFVIYSEAPNPTRHRSQAKLMFQRIIGFLIAQKAIGVLTVSHFAEDFYRSLGVSNERIYPFGYFRSHNFKPASHTNTGTEKEIIFVGQLAQRKGLDILFSSLPIVLALHSTVTITIIGTGPELDNLKELAEQLGVTSAVKFMGSISSDAILQRIVEAAILVLPSRWDGWGLVVNEALSVGVPVVLSDFCGASDLIRHGQNGYVFISEDTGQLTKVLLDHMDNISKWPSMKEEALHTGQKISVEQVTPYFLDCIRHMTGVERVRPKPPWQILDAS